MPFFQIQSEPYTPAFEYAELAGSINLSGEVNPLVLDKSVSADLEGNLLLSGGVNVYASVAEALDGEIHLRGSVEPEISTKHIFGEFAGGLNLRGEVNPDVILTLTDPEPILNEISETAFQPAAYFAR